MKILLLSAFIVFSSHSMLTSQSFVSKDNKWVIEQRNFPFPGSTPKLHLIYWFKDEVLIDGKEYLSLYTARLGVPVFRPTQWFFRELGSLIYMFDMETGDESLLYDFGRSEGGIFALENHPNKIISGSIEEIIGLTLLDGTSVNAYEVELEDVIRYLIIEDVFVEGIGSLTYPFRPGYWSSDSREELACFLRNDTLLYSLDEDLSFCAQFGIVPPETNVTNISSEFQNQEITVYTKDGKIYYSGIEDSGLTMSLFDVIGRKVCQLQSSYRGFVLPAISSGLYICVLKKSNELVHTQMLFIN